MDSVAVVEVLAVLAGLVVVLVTGADAVSTLVTTRRRRGRRWPTPAYYRWSWRAWRAIGRRRSPEWRESFLGVYGPLSLLGLLVFWVMLLVAGWGAVWWGLRSAVPGVHGYLDAVYFAGVGFFTVGFGDLVPTDGLARLLVIVEAFMGLLTMALLIGYLPTLYSAYSRRELQLLALDDLMDEPTTPASFLEAAYANGGREGVAAAFADWERWCDDVFDTHTAFPMLALYRSRQPGQHWLTGLAVVLDAAALSLAIADPGPSRPAARLWRRATRLLQGLRGLPAVGLKAGDAGPGADEARFRAVYERLAGLGEAPRPYPEAWEAYRRLRTAYVPELVAATELLLVPMEFRHQTSPLDLTSG